MARLGIGHINFLEQNFADLSSSIGAWGGTLDNIKDPEFGNPAISVDATTTSTQIAIDTGPLVSSGGGVRGADALFIPRHNLTQSATIRVKAGDAPFTSGGSGGGTVAYDSTAIAALTQVMYPAGYTNAHGRNNVNTPDPIIDAAYNRGALVLFGTTKYARYWWIGISDTGNPDGVISLGRAYLGPLWTPSFNADFGAVLSLDGTRSAVQSVSNAEFIDPAPRLYRVLTMQMSDLPMDEALSVWQPMLTYLGYARQALFVWDPAATYHAARTTFMAVQQKPGSFAFRYFDHADLPCVFKEVI